MTGVEEGAARGSPAAAPYRPLRRRSQGKLVAGVAAGLADYTGLDPVLFRIAFVVLAVLDGAGALLYGLAVLLIPREDEERSAGERALHRVRRTPVWWLVGAIVLALGVAALADGLNYGFWAPSALWALALIAIGVLLLRDDGAPVERAPAAAARTAAAESRPSTPRSALGWLTLAAVLLVLGVAALLDNAGVVALEPGQFAALALVVVGAGLIVGAWVGRARWLVLLGVLLVPVVLATSVVGLPSSGVMGDVYLAPRASVAQADDTAVLLGNTTVDLRRFQFPIEGTHMELRSGLGDVYVLVPRDVPVKVDASVGLGEITVFGRTEHGFGVRLAAAQGDVSMGHGLTLEIRSAMGSIVVQRPDRPGATERDAGRERREQRVHDAGRPKEGRRNDGTT